MFDIEKRTIEMYSFVINRFSMKECFAVGYNPMRNIRTIYHTFFDLALVVCNIKQSWMHSGDNACSTNFEGFMTGMQKVLPVDKIVIIRADIGFACHSKLADLEAKKIKNIINSRFRGDLQQKKFEQHNWYRECKCNGVASFTFHFKVWEAPMRILAVQKITSQLLKSEDKTFFRFTKFSQSIVMPLLTQTWIY